MATLAWMIWMVVVAVVAYRNGRAHQARIMMAWIHNNEEGSR